MAKCKKKRRERGIIKKKVTRRTAIGWKNKRKGGI